MEYKSVELTDVKLIDEAQGIVEAFVNSMGLIDTDGDVIDSAAFNNSISMNMPVTVLQGHDTSKVVGKVLDAYSVNNMDGSARLYNKIQFNMDTQLGRETFSNVAGGYIKEWSVGFNIPEGGAEILSIDDGARTVRVISDVDWVEVSSVIRGASPGTTTVSAKDDKVAIPYRATGETDVAWNGPRTVAAIPNDAGRGVLRQMFAYVDADEDPASKGSYKFPHHQWDGGASDANLRACIAGIAALNGARGGSSIPGADRAGVYRHLSRHLDAAGNEAPELLSADQADEILGRREDERRRRRQYGSEIADQKEVTEHVDEIAATDDQPIIGEAWTPVTDEQRQQVSEKLAEERARMLGFRLQKNKD